MNLGRRPRFPDGELDLWPACKSALPKRAAIDSPAKRQVEERRHEHIDALSRYAIWGGTSFFVTPPNNVRIVKGRLDDIWAFHSDYEGKNAIQIPRQVVAKRPELGDDVQFRSDVPAFHILGSMAHELAHRDRATRDPERHNATFAGFSADNRYKLDLSRVWHEEIATDVEAYGILQNAGVPLTPCDYIATVPQPPDYRKELARLL